MSVKVFKTSIVPQGESLEGVGVNQAQVESHTLEIIHVFCFIGIILFLFKKLWQEAQP